MKGLKQNAFAKEINALPSTLCQWEHGARVPQVENLLLILKWARKNDIAVSFDDFFTGHLSPLPEWIKCRDKMPVKNEDVLVFCDYIHIAFYDVYHDGTQGFYNSENNCPLMDVEYWMPLPENPK